MQGRKEFLALFMIVGFFMKIVGEFVHEVCGHGFFVLLFRGEITGLYISVLWPYDFSRMSWFLPSSIGPAQMAWIFGGGILVCLCTSFVSQTFLLVKEKIPWYFAITLFWLAFWTLVNSTGYLIIGGLTPLGDVKELIALGVLTNLVSLATGLIMFFIGFVALSWILRKILAGMFPLKKASLGVFLLWLIIPVLVMVMLANPERSLQLAYLPLTFIPAILSSVIEYFLVLSKQEADANPDYVAKQ